MKFDQFKVTKTDIVGSGSDAVGDFSLEGKVNEDGEVTFIKQYIGQHAVNYTGTYNKGSKSIEGQWEVSGYTGGFKISAA